MELVDTFSVKDTERIQNNWRSPAARWNKEEQGSRFHTCKYVLAVQNICLQSNNIWSLGNLTSALDCLNSQSTDRRREKNVRKRQLRDMEAGWRLSEEIEWSTDASLSQGWCNDASLLGSIITAENWVCPSIKALIPSPTPNMLWQRRIFPSARPVSPHTSRVDVCDWQFYYSWVRWVWSGYIEWTMFGFYAIYAFKCT